MQETNDIKKYFDLNASCLNVRGIELRAEVPPKTLAHFLKGRRNLNEESTKKIVAVLKQIQYK